MTKINADSLINLLAWSPSRYQALRICPRKYYYSHVLFGGWRPDADPLTRTAYRLKHLTSVELQIGLIIHRRIRAILESSCRHVAPVLAKHIAVAQGELRTAIATGAEIPLTRVSKVYPKLLRQHLGETISAEEIREGEARIARLLENFIGLDEVKRLLAHPESLLKEYLDPDQPTLTECLGVPAYLKTDAVSADQDRHVIWEWKTGKPSASHREKTIVYEIFVRRQLRLTDDRSVVVRLVYLDTPAVEEITSTLEEREELLFRTESEFTDICFLSDDRIVNCGPMTRFPARPGWPCRDCVFQTLCPEAKVEKREGK